MKSFTDLKLGIIVFLVIAFLSNCKKENDTQNNPPTNPLTDINNTFGYNILNKLKGIWNGSISSTTALGSYPEWIVDFRPISENQISSKNELDPLNDIHMSFFITKFKNEYRVCFRNGGSFNGLTRSSYLIADSVSETATQQYYRFSEIVIGKKRAYSELIFKQDSLIMNSYTNHYNTGNEPTLHSSWRAKLEDTTAYADAVTHFNFPRKTLTIDLSSTFDGVSESIFYSTTGGDPYTEEQQPYLGRTSINYNFGSGFTPDPNKKVFLLITTKPLINGFTLNTANWKTRSRYVTLTSTTGSYTFNYMHPGNYYVYGLYDNDGNRTFSSGDRASVVNTSFSLTDKGNSSQTVQINFTIP